MDETAAAINSERGQGPLLASILRPAPARAATSGAPTAKHDMSAELEGYFALPSIQHYIIADPDRPMLIVHSRRHDARAADGTLSTRLVSDPSAVLRLDPPGLTVGLAEVLAA